VAAAWNAGEKSRLTKWKPIAMNQQAGKSGTARGQPIGCVECG
jgi:hypothetical protein